MANSIESPRGRPLVPNKAPSPRGSFILCLERFGARLSCADTYNVLDRYDPHLAVTDLVGAAGLRDLVDHGHRVRVIDEYLDLHLGHEVDLVLRAAVHLRVTALPAEALH